MTLMRPRRASAIARSAGLLTLGAALATGALADDQIAEIRAVAAPLRPFVVEEGGRLTGFSIDLWNEVAARLRVKTSYQLLADFPALYNSLKANEADVLVMGVFYTSEWDREFDFSHPILTSGLQVMVRGTGLGTSDRPLRAFLKVLFSGGMVYWLTAALLLILVPAHVIWWLDRRSPDGVSQGEKYLPGIFYAMAWTAESLVSQAQQMPRRRVARLIGIVWLYIGVVFVAFLTANLTATLTVEQIRGAINGPQDLPGREVGTLAGPVFTGYLRDIGASAHPYTRDDEMYAALLSGEVDAVVSGAPLLRYYAAHDGLGKVRIVGPEIKKGDICFVVQLNSPLRKRISSALVTLHEDGTYQRIYEKWFGGE